MTKPMLFAAAAVLALSGCNEAEKTTVETPVATDTAMAPAPAVTEPATGNMAGTYEVTLADGTKVTETIKSDGTYVDVANGKETKGTWRMDGANSCFDPEGTAPEVCYTTGAAAADGSFQVTAPDGKVYATVRKVGA